MPILRVTEDYIKQLKRMEGLVNVAYKPLGEKPTELYTIGYGHYGVNMVLLLIPLALMLYYVLTWDESKSKLNLWICRICLLLVGVPLLILFLIAVYVTFVRVLSADSLSLALMMS